MPTMHHNRRARLLPYLLLLPAFAVMGLVVFYPMLYNIVNSTFSVQEFERAPEFIGLGHYQDLLSDSRFFDSLRLTLVWTVGCTIAQYTIGLFFALVLNSRLRVIRYVRPLYILPWIIPGVAAAVAFRFMYANDYGLINVMLRSIGLDSVTQPWIATKETAMFAAVLLGTWKGFPFYMVMLLAGLQNIPEELVEAARIDGASRWQVVRHVQLPLLKAVSSVSLLLGIIWTSNYFDGIFLLTGGGPARATQTLPIYIYNVGFANFELSKASAVSVLLLVIVIVLATLYLAIARRGYVER